VIGDAFQSIDCVRFCINREEVDPELLLKVSVRATGVELQEIPQLIIIVKYGYNLPPGDSSEN